MCVVVVLVSEWGDFALLVARLVRRTGVKQGFVCIGEDQTSAGEEGRVQLDSGIICRKKKK